MRGDFIIYASPMRERRDSHALLLRATALFTGCGNGTPTLESSPEGKPYFPDYPAVFFSLTHSGTWWMCAFGGEPVGLDLQQHQNCARERIAKRFFHPAENAFLQSSGYDAFFDVWAAKESFLKYTGEGMRRPLSGFSVVSGEALSSGTEGAQLRLLPFLPDYSLCLCAAEIGGVRLVRDWS